jgi:hypothetical protein
MVNYIPDMRSIYWTITTLTRGLSTGQLQTLQVVYLLANYNPDKRCIYWPITNLTTGLSTGQLQP